MMSKKQDRAAIEEAPGLGDIKALFPPTSASDSVPLAANVSLKLTVFWPDATEVRILVYSSGSSVCDQERNS